MSFTRATRIVMTTDLHQAKRLADDVLFMYGGQVLEHTSAERFFDTPASRRPGRLSGENWFGDPHSALNNTQRSRP